MNYDLYISLIVMALAAFTVLVCVACVVVGGSRTSRFDRHVQDDLDMVAADKRSTGLDANAAWNGWY